MCWVWKPWLHCRSERKENCGQAVAKIEFVTNAFSLEYLAGFWKCGAPLASEWSVMRWGMNAGLETSPISIITPRGEAKEIPLLLFERDFLKTPSETSHHFHNSEPTVLGSPKPVWSNY
jgi:hypothetical protein